LCFPEREVTDPRAHARELARESIARGDVTGWFERLYAESMSDGVAISWVDLVPNPYLVEWADLAPPEHLRGRAIVVGCGYGDDAEYLVGRGLEVVGFDIAPSALARCRERFPESAVQYLTADLLAPPAAWAHAFDFVFEAYTIQVLRGAPRAAAARSIGSLVRQGGRLLVVARGRTPEEPEGTMPWPLTRAELDEFATSGLELVSLREILEPGDPPAPRFVAEFLRP
jgi:SAM-dependent methyltransferase